MNFDREQKFLRSYEQIFGGIEVGNRYAQHGWLRATNSARGDGTEEGRANMEVE